MFAILLLASTVSLPLPTGHWDGVIHGPTDVVIAVDLTAKAGGELAGTFDNAAPNLHSHPLPTPPPKIPIPSRCRTSPAAARPSPSRSRATAAARSRAPSAARP